MWSEAELAAERRPAQVPLVRPALPGADGLAGQSLVGRRQARAHATFCLGVYRASAKLVRVVAPVFGGLKTARATFKT